MQSEVIDRPVDDPPRRRRRRRILWASAVGLLVLLAAAVVGAGVYVGSYQPLSDAVGGFAGTAGSLVPINDGAATTRYIITGRQGAKGSFAFWLGDKGPHPVTILGLRGDYAPAGFSIRWSPTLTQGPGVNTAPSLAQSQPMPAHINAHGAIQIWMTVTKPDCQSGAGEEVDAFGLRWSAMGWHHTTLLSLLPVTVSGGLPYENGSLIYPVAVCAPAATLKHIGRAP